MDESSLRQPLFYFFILLPVKASAACAGASATRWDDGVVTVVTVDALAVRWEKFINREADLAEGVAGIFCLAGAFLIRNAEIIGGNQDLNIALQLHNGKQTQRNLDCFFLARIVERSVKAAADTAGNAIGTVGNVVAAVAWTADPYIQTDRIGNLNFCSWVGGAHRKLLIVPILGVFRRENLDLAFAAVQDTFF